MLKGPTLIIDADIFLYQEAFSAESNIPWEGDPDFWTVIGDLKKAERGFISRVEEITERTEIDEVFLCFSGRRCFRYDIFPDYKKNRKNTRKPVLLTPLRESMMEKYPSLLVEDLEADDLLGILSRPDDVMVSSDKDLMTVSGRHFIPRTPEVGILEVSEDEARRTHFIQTLCGDTADNFKGCPKVGPVTARKLIKEDDDAETQWEAVLTAFKKQGLTEEDALVQARLAFILRGNVYRDNNHQVKLWNIDYYTDRLSL